MRWIPGGTSQDVEDRRGQGGGGFRGAGLGVGGTIVVFVLSLIFGKDFFQFFADVPSDATAVSSGAPPAAEDPQEKQLVQFVSFVLDDAQQTWERLLPQQGSQYRHAKLVLFRDITDSGCGTAQSATGPFYCPDDEKVYIDLSFYDELKRRFGAPGEFAQAYVLAHEIGHHVQQILGIAPRVHALQERNPGQANELSVRLELQADCFAGIWGNSPTKPDLIEDADIQAGMQAAAAVGDDHLQKMARGRVSPESFTHGSSAQRVEWFRRGLESGQVRDCDTFTSR